MAPHCRLGFQQVGHEFALYNGPDWAPIYRETDERQRVPAGARLGHGCYSDARPREMIHKAMIIARQVARLPESIDAICPEIENFTHNAMGKTAHGTVVESTLDLAMGCNCLSYAILCSGHEPMEWYGQTLLSRLAAWRPFWERIIADNRGTQLGGLDIALGRGQVARPLRDGEKPFAWAQIDLGQLSQLATLGLPLCPDSPAACGSLLHADAVDGFTDAELKRLLAGGLVIDGAACVRLNERGLGSLLGVTAERLHPLDCHERLTADPINGPHAGRQWWLWFASEHRRSTVCGRPREPRLASACWARRSTWPVDRPGPQASPSRTILAGASRSSASRDGTTRSAVRSAGRCWRPPTGPAATGCPC